VKISLDREALLLLSSETRMEILRSIADRRKTLSELSKEIGISKSSVKEHLEKLEKAGLIRRVDEGRKWIYYEITEEGAKIVRPEPERKVIVRFVVSMAMFISGLVMLTLYYMESLRSRVQVVPSAVRETPVPAKEIEKAITTPTPAPTPIPSPVSTPISGTPVPAPTATPTPISEYIQTPAPKAALTPTPAETPAIHVTKAVGGVSDAMFYIALTLIVLSFILLALQIRRR